MRTSRGSLQSCRCEDPARLDPGLRVTLHGVIRLLFVVVPWLVLAQPTWVEDFKNPVGGFDRRWKLVQPAGSQARVEFDSTGETGRLRVEGGTDAYASVVTTDWIVSSQLSFCGCRPSRGTR